MREFGPSLAHNALVVTPARKSRDEIEIYSLYFCGVAALLHAAGRHSRPKQLVVGQEEVPEEAWNTSDGKPLNYRTSRVDSSQHPKAAIDL